VREIENLTDATYILRFSRNNMKFKPGQHLVAGLEGSKDLREYSIYSGTKDEDLEILIREVDGGMVSKKLRNLSRGDKIEINGPYGFFMYNAQNPGSRKYTFIASGTGIAPFRSFARSHPGADYKVIHGIRNLDDAYGSEDFLEGTYFSCTSRDSKGNYIGRITDYLKEAEIEKDRMFYLCGNSEMILDAIDILKEKGIYDSQIFTEIYF